MLHDPPISLTHTQTHIENAGIFLQEEARPLISVFKALF